MRAKMAAIRVCSAAAKGADGIVASAWGVVGEARKPANWSANGISVSIGHNTN